MYSGLTNILSAQSRIAEHTDTRQELHHHDPEYQRHQKKNKHQPQDQDFHDAVISVEALEIFLQNYIKTSYDRRKASESYDGEDRRKTPQKQIDDVQKELDLNIDKRQKSAQAARAAYAYQSTNAAKQKPQILLETTDQATGPSMDITEADLESVKALLDKIKILNQHKIQYIAIERGATFLISLHSAMDKAIQNTQTLS